MAGLSPPFNPSLKLYLQFIHCWVNDSIGWVTDCLGGRVDGLATTVQVARAAVAAAWCRLCILRALTFGLAPLVLAYNYRPSSSWLFLPGPRFSFGTSY